MVVTEELSEDRPVHRCLVVPGTESRHRISYRKIFAASHFAIVSPTSFATLSFTA